MRIQEQPFIYHFFHIRRLSPATEPLELQRDDWTELALNERIWPTRERGQIADLIKWAALLDSQQFILAFLR